MERVDNMAGTWLHSRIDIIKRSYDRSNACGHCAYILAEKIRDEDRNKTHDYTNKENVIYKNHILPTHVARTHPEWKNPERFWNDVQNFETKQDARFARKIDLSLPDDIPVEDMINICDNWAEMQRQKGMVVTYALHYKNNGKNPHIDAMVNLRDVDEKTGEWLNKKSKQYYDINKKPCDYAQSKKDYGEAKYKTVPTRNWDSFEMSKKWRREMQDLSNEMLRKNGIDRRIDERSYEEQGLDLEPTIHLGHKATAIKEKYENNKSDERSYLADENNEIIRNNIIRIERYMMKDELNSLKRDIKKKEKRKQTLDERLKKVQRAIKALENEKRKEAYILKTKVLTDDERKEKEAKQNERNERIAKLKANANKLLNAQKDEKQRAEKAEGRKQYSEQKAKMREELQPYANVLNRGARVRKIAGLMQYNDTTVNIYTNTVTSKNPIVNNALAKKSAEQEADITAPEQTQEQDKQVNTAIAPEAEQKQAEQTEHGNNENNENRINVQIERDEVQKLKENMIALKEGKDIDNCKDIKLMNDIEKDEYLKEISIPH